MPIDGISLAPWQLEQRTDFTGGENIRLVPGLVAKSQIILGQNCELSPEGLLRTRLGKRKLLTTPIGAGGVLGVWTFGTTAGTNYLIVHHGTSIYAGEWDGTSQDPTLTEIKTGLTANARFNVEVWKDNIFFANGNDAIFRFDGTTTTTLLDSPPLSYLVKVYEGRLYVVDAANPNLLRYSGLEDYDDWHGLNVINVRDGDGDEIKNILPVNGGMALVKTRNIFILYGTNKDNFKLNAMPASGAAGATGYFSGNDGGIVLGRDSWFTVQTNGVKPVGITHSPLLQDMTLDQLADTTAVAQKRYLRGYYLLGNGERTIVMMDGKSGAIFRWTGLDAGAIGVADCEGFDDDILIGDADEGTVYILDN